MRGARPRLWRLHAQPILPHGTAHAPGPAEEGSQQAGGAWLPSAMPSRLAGQVCGDAPACEHSGSTGGSASPPGSLGRAASACEARGACLPAMPWGPVPGAHPHGLASPALVCCAGHQGRQGAAAQEGDQAALHGAGRRERRRSNLRVWCARAFVPAPAPLVFPAASRVPIFVPPTQGGRRRKSCRHGSLVRALCMHPAHASLRSCSSGHTAPRAPRRCAGLPTQFGSLSAEPNTASAAPPGHAGRAGPALLSGPQPDTLGP